MERLLCCAGLVLGAGAALGQVAGFNIEPVFGPGQTGITPQTPSCIIRASARFSPNDFALAGVRFDMVAAEGSWSAPRVLLPVGQYPGTIAGPSVTGITGGQLNFPVEPRPDPSNPIGAWEATWTTTNFTPRRVRFRSVTSRFDVYTSPNWPAGESRMNGLTEGLLELRVGACYADCDTGSGPWVLDVADFLCFQNRYALGTPYACDCDTSTGPGACDVFDFLCFQNAFVAGCP